MVQKVRSFGLQGMGGFEISVECFLSGGLPGTDIVGLAGTAVKEARDRVRAAIKSSGFKYPQNRITINLAPAGSKKEGTIYDLPILLCILAAANEISQLPEDAAFLGELSLTGETRPIAGVLPMTIAAVRCGVKKIFVPEENADEATLAGDIEVYPVKNVKQLIVHLSGEEQIQPREKWIPKASEVTGPDFADVKGQENVKRALEVAAAGGHNILLIGPPGTGKSMLAHRLFTILPDMTFEESLECTEIYSITGKLSKENPMINARPFRGPHHTISAVGLSGGGTNPKPGEVSLAHNGVLFLDEFPEFARDVLEVLRQPLEDGEVSISRASGTVIYPARFMLVCAMNPCKCGWYGYERCRCTENSVKQYIGKVSGPLIDRIDIFVDVPAMEYEELSKKASGESSAEIKKRVNRARECQRARFCGTGIMDNAHMNQKQLGKYCELDGASQKMMKAAFDKLGLTARSYDKILRVARTIADLDGAENIEMAHLAEAIQYKSVLV